MVIVTTVESWGWGKPYIRTLGVISDELYDKYKAWVEEDRFRRRDFGLEFIRTDDLKDLTYQFIEKMK